MSAWFRIPEQPTNRRTAKLQCCVLCLNNPVNADVLNKVRAIPGERHAYNRWGHLSTAKRSSWLKLERLIYSSYSKNFGIERCHDRNSTAVTILLEAEQSDVSICELTLKICIYWFMDVPIESHLALSRVDWTDLLVWYITWRIMIMWCVTWLLNEPIASLHLSLCPSSPDQSHWKAIKKRIFNRWP